MMDPNKKPPLIVDGVQHPLTVSRDFYEAEGHYLVLTQTENAHTDLIYVEESSIPQLEDAIAKVKAEIQAAKGGGRQEFRLRPIKEVMDEINSYEFGRHLVVRQEDLHLHVEKSNKGTQLVLWSTTGLPAADKPDMLCVSKDSVPALIDALSAIYEDMTAEDAPTAKEGGDGQ